MSSSSSSFTLKLFITHPSLDLNCSFASDVTAAMLLVKNKRNSELYFQLNSSRKNSFVLTPNMAALSRGCKPRILCVCSLERKTGKVSTDGRDACTKWRQIYKSFISFSFNLTTLSFCYKLARLFLVGLKGWMYHKSCSCFNSSNLFRSWNPDSVARICFKHEAAAVTTWTL